jgi:hypothetical protein
VGVEIARVGLLPAFFAVQERLDFVVRENEAIISGLVGQIFVFVHFQDLGGLVELALFGSAAVGLDLAELSEGALELAGKTLAVNADVGEGAHLFTKCHSHGEGGLGLRMVGAEAVFHFDDAQREEVGLDSGGAVHAPGGVDEGLDKLGFGGVFGAVFSQKGLGVALIRGVVLGGQDDGLAGQAVAQRVERGALFTGFGAGAGGFLALERLMAVRLIEARSAARSLPVRLVDSVIGFIPFE